MRAAGEIWKHLFITKKEELIEAMTVL
jgi:hypothetical protein